MELDAEHVRSILDYNPETGVFTWKVGRRRVKAGEIAGYTRSDGYVVLSINQNKCFAHRLAWLLSYGVLPKEIDHVNRNRADNRISNLRAVAHIENQWNMRPRNGSPSGYMGMCKRKGQNKWSAQISVKYKQKHLGLFNTPEEAAEAYQKAKKEMHKIGE